MVTCEYAGSPNSNRNRPHNDGILILERRLQPDAFLPLSLRRDAYSLPDSARNCIQIRPPYRSPKTKGVRIGSVTQVPTATLRAQRRQCGALWRGWGNEVNRTSARSRTPAPVLTRTVSNATDPAQRRYQYLSGVSPFRPFRAFVRCTN